MRITANGLHVTLGGRPVVNGVTLAADPGEMVAVLGPNGAGKSTLLRSLAGLIEPHSGDVRLDDAPLRTLDRRTLGRRVAFLPQDRMVHWPMSARAIVALGRAPYGDAAQASEIIERAMVEMDVAALAERPVTALSGGERARVLIARALAQETPVLIADEPSAGLDPEHQIVLCESLRRLATTGRTIVYALHDLSLAARFSTRLILLADGVVRAEGPPGQCLTPKVLAEVFAIRARVEVLDGIPLVVAQSTLR